MNRKTKQVLPVLLSIMLVLAVFSLLPTVTLAADITVTIADTESVAEIQAKIQAAIDGVQSGDTVTVTGNKTEADATLELNIPTGVKVLWKAEYSALIEDYSEDDDSLVGTVVSLEGMGTFDLVTGGKLIGILSSEAAYASVVVSESCVVISGGEILVVGETAEVYWWQADGVLAETVIMTGGRVDAAAHGISGSHIIISGGEVRSGGWTIDSEDDPEGIIEISGGTVIAKEGGVAIQAYGSVVVTGGSVLEESYDNPDSTYPAVSFFRDEAVVTVLKNTMFGDGWRFDYASTTVNKSVFVEVDTLAVPANRHGTSEGLILKADVSGSASAGSRVTWDMSGDKPQIKVTLLDGSIKMIPWGTKIEMPSPTPTATPTSTPTPTPSAPDYTITDGANGTWEENATGMTITSNGDFEKFQEVKVDGAIVDPANYTAVSGSTIITFKPEYLATLSPGEHTVELLFSDGGVSTTLTISEESTPTAAAPTITGSTSMSLNLGYGSRSTDAYTLTGTTPITVTQNSTHGGKIMWNSATQKLDIASGLRSGTYSVTLTASNGVLPDATLTFTLTVTTHPQTGDDSNTLGWTVAFVLSLVGVFGLAVWQKKHRRAIESAKK